MKIIIWTGEAYENWGESSITKGGIGGSETAAIHMARELAKLGHQVEMFGKHDGFEGSHTSNVTYSNYQKAMSDPSLLTCDILISSRDKRLHRLNPKAKLTVLWVHDIHVGDDWENEVPKFDLIFCLSQWAKKTFRGYYPLVPDEKVIVTRNGINPELFVQPVAELPAYPAYPTDYNDKYRFQSPRFTYSSSPDRGLDVLVSLWPEIQKMFYNEASLHVYYGFDNWEKMAKTPGGRAKVDFMKSLVMNQEGKGIYYHGRQPQDVVAKSHLESAIWFYPTDFKETYCITALEAQAAGSYVVTSDLAALSETVKYGAKLKPYNTDETYRTQALEHIAWAACHPQKTRESAEQSRQWALTQTWASLAKDWISLFLDGMHA